MTISARNLLVLGATLLFAWVCVPYLHWQWSLALIDGRSFSSTTEWIRPPSLLSWLFYLLAFFPLGFAVAWLSVGARTWMWALLLGLLYGFAFFLLSRNTLFEPPLSIYFYVYGTYAMPLIGSLAGAAVQQSVRRRRLN